MNSGRRGVFLPLSIPALSTVRTPPLSTLLWRGALAGGHTPTLLRRRPGCHGNSHSASVFLCHSWRYTVVRRQKWLRRRVGGGGGATKGDGWDWVTNLCPGTKAPLGFVVGSDFGAWGNRVAAGTLGQFTVLLEARTHTQPFMRRLTE